MFVREPDDPYKKLKEEAKLVNDQKIFNSNYIEQNSVVAVCEKYAIDLQRVFMAYVFLFSLSLHFFHILVFNIVLYVCPDINIFHTLFFFFPQNSCFFTNYLFQNFLFFHFFFYFFDQLCVNTNSTSIK